MPQQPNITELLTQIGQSPDTAAQAVTDYLTANPDTDLQAIEDAALDVSNEVYGDGNRTYSDEHVQQLTAVRALFDQVSSVRAEREQAAAERAAQVKDLRITPTAPAETTDTEQGGGDDTATEAAAQAAPADTSTALEPVAASSAPAPRPATQGGSDFARLAGGATGGGSRWSITAGADINGIPAGAPLADFGALTEAVTRRLEPMTRLGANTKHTAPIASIKLGREDALVAGASTDQGMRKLVDDAANESRLPGGSLTAAGLWCAPSETVYDLCPDLATTDGLVSLPSITINRGGIRYPQTPDYSAVYTQLQDGVWEWDPTDGAVNDPKPCVEIPCPGFDECVPSPYGLCITTDILVNHAWPELVNDWTQRLLTAQQHLVNARVIQKMLAASTTKAFSAEAGEGYTPGATQTILDILELQAVYLRTKNRMSRTATLEVILPTWVSPLIRADLAKRTGVDLVSVPDSRVDQYFRDRYLNVQYVYDFADIPTDAAPDTYPWTVQALMYPAGTFVRADTAIIELSGIYDSTQLANNKFTGLFAESAECVIKRCYDALHLTIAVCPNGATAAATDYTCPTI
jgi:hypothetical protein